MTDSVSIYRAMPVLTLANAEPALQAGLRAISEGKAEFDLATLTGIDSSAVAVLVAWRRAARVQGRALRFFNVPPNLRSLAQLYGVADLLYSTSEASSAGVPSHAELPHH